MEESSPSLGPRPFRSLQTYRKKEEPLEERGRGLELRKKMERGGSKKGRGWCGGTHTSEWREGG